MAVELKVHKVVRRLDSVVASVTIDALECGTSRLIYQIRFYRDPSGKMKTDAESRYENGRRGFNAHIPNEPFRWMARKAAAIMKEKNVAPALQPSPTI